MRPMILWSGFLGREVVKIKVVKEGDPNRLKASKRFQCDECGCVFEADKDEYQSDMQYNTMYFYCECPCCGKTARPILMREEV